MSHPTERILGDAASIRALRDQIRGLSDVPAVLLLGETGTGKGLVARVIHDCGARAAGPFLDVNCAAIPETLLEAELFGYEAGAFTDARRPKPGLFEVASGGTLFLDELDALSLALQSTLLIAIEEKRIRRLGAVRDLQVNVTLVAATQVDVPAAVAAGRFRADLYDRLAVVLMSLPPLRARGDDVLLLARDFLDRYAESHGLVVQRLDATAEEWLRNHPWPGNVRELGHLMERVTLLHKDRVISREALEAVCLPQAATAAGVGDGHAASGGHLDVGEADRIRAVLARTAGNVARAARLLEMSRGALRHRMTRVGIAPPRLDDARPAASADRPTAKRRSRAADTRRKDWTRKPVVVLAVEVTWPPSDGDRLVYEPLTAASRLEKTVEQKARGFGGLVVQRSASLVVIVFGAPRTLDQLPQRAMQAAFAIRQEIAQSAGTAEGAVGPRVRQGLHWGELLVTTETREGLVDFRPVDDVLAQPVRLLGHAANNEILVTADLVSHVEGWCDLAPRGAAGAQVVLDAKLRRSPFAGRGSRPLSHFVGRDREVTTLEELLQHAAQWHGQMVSVVGEPGVGKSRLIREVVNGPQCDGWLVVHAGAVSHGKAVPYLPISDLLRSYFEIDALDRPPAIVAQATERVLALDEALEPVLPALLALLDAPADDAKWKALDAARRRQHTIEALKRLFLRECQVRPVLVVVEDLHWSDTETLAVLDALVEALPAARVLLLVTSRPEWRHAWGSKSHYTQVRLAPLALESSRQLVQELLGDDATLASLEPALLERTAGNPLFIEETVHALADTGTLVGGRGRYQLARRLETLVVAPTIQAVLAARIDRLSREERDVLLAAAIVGTQVPRVLLREVTELDDDTLQKRVAALLAAEFLYETALFPEVVYTFKHALTHDAAYGAVPRERRRTGHARVAERLVQLSGERLAERTELIAHHAVRGEQWDTAVLWLRRAGARAAARGVLPEATARFEHALRFLDQLPAGREREELGIDLRLDLQSVLNPQGRFDELTKHLAEAEAIADALGDQPRLARIAGFLTHTHRWRGELDRAIDAGTRAVEIAATLGDRDAEVVARYQLGVAYVSAGHFRLALPHYRRIIVVLRGAPIDEYCGLPALPAITSRAFLANALGHLGEFEEATALCAQALRLAETAGHAFTLANTLLVAGTMFTVRGHLAEAIARLERALALMEANEIVSLLPLTSHRLASAYARAGRVRDAVGLLERGHHVTESGRQPMQEARHWLAFGEVYLQAGRIDEAFRSAQQALAGSRAYGMRAYEMQALLSLGAIHAAMNPPAVDEATAHHAAALELADKLGARPFVAQAHLGLGKLYRRAGDRGQARHHLGIALVMFREMDIWMGLEEAEHEMAAPSSS